MILDPAEVAQEITPNDTTIIPSSRGIYVGGAGNIKLRVGGTAITFVAVPAGSLLPIRADIVYDTGTTASSIVSMY